MTFMMNCNVNYVYIGNDREIAWACNLKYWLKYIKRVKLVLAVSWMYEFPVVTLLWEWIMVRECGVIVKINIKGKIAKF